MTKNLNIEIKKLSPHLLTDYLTFFDHHAFLDNPEWAFCYCHFNQFPHDELVWKDQTAENNRKAVCTKIQNGRMNGYLAYYQNNVVGWCNAGPRSGMTTVPEYPEPEEKNIGSIVCFVIDTKYRRMGIARQLLKTACAGLFSEGFTILEGYPLKDVAGEKENHFGPIALYLSAGFTPYNEDEDTIVMRKYPEQ